jgi:hypothetical protein
LHRTPSFEALMKTNQSSILIFGHDGHLLATRQWVLQTRGYRVLTIENSSTIQTIPQTPPVKLLVLCHSLSPAESATAVAMATSRWPEIQTLALVAESARAPAGILGQLLHTMEGPAKLISLVGQLVGKDASIADSHHL